MKSTTVTTPLSVSNSVSRDTSAGLACPPPAAPAASARFRWFRAALRSMRPNQNAGCIASRSNPCGRPARRCAGFRSAHSSRSGYSIERSSDGAAIFRQQDCDGDRRHFDLGAIDSSSRFGRERYPQPNRVARDRVALRSLREVANHRRLAAVEGDPARRFVETNRVELELSILKIPHAAAKTDQLSIPFENLAMLSALALIPIQL